MRFVNDSYHFLGTGGSVTAAAADLHLDNHNFWVDGCTPKFPTINYGFIASSPQFSSTWLPSVAEVLQITTLTPTQATAVGQVYQFSIIQVVNGSIQVLPVKYTSVTASDTTTVISTGLKNAINAIRNKQVTVASTTTVVITAVSRSPIFVIGIQSTGAGLTQNTGTAGVHSYGTVADFIEQGITGYVVGQTYKTLDIKYKSDDNTAAANVTSSQNHLRLFVNDAATNFSDFNTRMIQIGEAETVAGVADPEAVEIFGSGGS